MEDKIRTQIETIKKQREDFMIQANQQIAAMNGAIQALEALLSDGSTPTEDTSVSVIE